MSNRTGRGGSKIGGSKISGENIIVDFVTGLDSESSPDQKWHAWSVSYTFVIPGLTRNRPNQQWCALNAPDTGYRRHDVILFVLFFHRIR
ncbi:hypothetical protein [Nitrosovibrio sp. Nv6]|uniref:hypothetical protein n=1 Tax=Nitrosovibrio sp. Nv6 TaxID=1855340 RepID=UPI0008BAA13B|nr:hypothetical protein [Nitrosovibrio sp. Nv6]SEP41832.1 hypothetical protein SAMN05216316_2968 [Nitrosovibrio sp. Nv6]